MVCNEGGEGAVGSGEWGREWWTVREGKREW